jgi:hypothetical protein
VVIREKKVFNEKRFRTFFFFKKKCWPYPMLHSQSIASAPAALTVVQKKIENARSSVLKSGAQRGKNGSTKRLKQFFVKY